MAVGTYNRPGSAGTEHFRTSGGTGASASVPFIPTVGVAEHVRTYDGVNSLTVTSASQALPSIPATATHAELYCESVGGTATDAIRFWPHATAPTSTAGFKLKDDYTYLSSSPATFRAILNSGSGSCVLRIAYYHYE